MRLNTTLVLLFTQLHAQANTAVSSGSVGACSTYNYPATLYNTASVGYVINDGVTVLTDENRYGGYISVPGTGAMNFSGTNGIYFSGSGANTSCIPPVPVPDTGASYSYVCYSQKDSPFTTVNGYTVTPSVSGDISMGSYLTYGVSSLCGHPVCTDSDVTTNYFDASSGGLSRIYLTFSRPVTNIRLIVSSFSDFEHFTVTTNGGTPVLSTCSGAVISGNTFQGPNPDISTVDLNIGGVWYTSVTLSTIDASVGLGYGYGAASAY